MVDYQNKTVIIRAELRNSFDQETTEHTLLDTFDFDNDPGRGWYKNAAVNVIHKTTPPGSTSFKIYMEPGTVSKFEKIYSFEEFLKNE